MGDAFLSDHRVATGEGSGLQPACSWTRDPIHVRARGILYRYGRQVQLVGRLHADALLLHRCRALLVLARLHGSVKRSYDDWTVIYLASKAGHATCAATLSKARGTERARG